MTYDLKALKTPRLTGKTLKSLVSLLENGASRQLISPVLLGEIGAKKMRGRAIEDDPSYLPIHSYTNQPSSAAAKASLKFSEGANFTRNTHPLPTSLDLGEAYRHGEVTPTDIAERCIEMISASNQHRPALNAIIDFNTESIRQQARESRERFERKAPLGWLDGVPVAVKDEMNVKGYATRVGTQVFGQDGPADFDATAVGRLRAQGAIIIGKANMHEIGIGVTGANVHYGACRNPYSLAHYPGGSSSGSASAVAAGICPLSIGADGGGSIRIPAALCGMVGLKPTWGRVSEQGAFRLCWSVGHIGPIGRSVDDVALGYAAMAGPDPADPYSMHQPRVHLQNYTKSDLTGVRLGVFSPWFSHARPDIVQHCQLAVEHLKSLGAHVQEVHLPELDLQRIAHAITISAEMAAAVNTEARKMPGAFALDTRLNLAINKLFTSEDYVKAQQVRTAAMRDFSAIFREVDVMVSPTTAITAPAIRPKAVTKQESNLAALTELMRFSFSGNLTGLPGLSVPVAYDDQGLPIGLQLMGDAWQEALLLRVGRALESKITRYSGAIAYDLLRG